MEKLDFKILYKIQDKVLEIIFEKDNEFYLSGGTCLNRFYYEARYSFDLDFFTNFSHTFNLSIKNIFSQLNKNHLGFKIEIESKDFVRIVVENILQVDFINDKVKHFGEIERRGKYKIDNLGNILSNKITAVLSRDNAKDVFDIYFICKNLNFSWKNILEEANEKLIFNLEELIYRLESFPKVLIEKLILADKQFLNNFNSDYQILIDDIVRQRQNSLFSK